MASLTPTPKQQIYGSDGAPLVGGKIYTYSAGTTTPLATYTNSGGGTANTNPIILNSLGQADIWLGTGSYKFSVYTSADVLLYTVDNISAPLDSAGLATALSSPTPIGNTAPNTGAFTTLTATTGNITTVNATAVNATTVTPTTLTFSGGGSMTRPPQAGIQSITATAAANALTVTLNPTTLDFRSSTLTSGAVVSRTVSSAISMVVSSGSTLGTVSAVQSRIVVLAIDYAGTVELAVVNIAGGNDLTETGVISTTAEGGAGGADSASTIYSTTARTSVAYRVVGYVESTQATAGTWATTPSTIQGCGGQALTAMSSLGYGQTWQLVTGSRALATTYYNTTGRPITVVISTTGSVASSSSSLSITVNSVAILTQGLIYGAGGISSGPSVTFIVPSGQSYSATVTQATLTIWAELR
jgi:hypothetical protein